MQSMIYLMQVCDVSKCVLCVHKPEARCSVVHEKGVVCADDA